MRATMVLVLGVACAPPPEDEIPIDLVGPFGPDQARAGVVTDPAALPGGIAAEARPGDVVLVNDRVRFVVQAAGRASAGLVPFGGSVIDADLVRTDGTADADLVVEWTPALDVGWLPEATAVDVLDDGVESGVATVRVTAREAGFAYLGAVFEDPGQNTSRGLTVVTTYTLEAGTPLLGVETTITAGDEPVETRPGDILQTYQGLTSSWVPGVGRTSAGGAAEDAVMVVHDEHGLTLGLFADDDDGSSTPEGALDVLNFLVSFTSLYEPIDTVQPGASRTWRRWWGVGHHPAELTDAWAARTGLATRRVEASVKAEGIGVEIEGARVTAVVDGLPWTMALTDAQGRVAFELPAEGEVRLVADGSGSRVVRDLTAGAGDASPLAEVSRREAALTSIRSGATPVPHARGWGRAEGAPGEAIELPVQGRLRVHSDDANTFEVQVRAVDVDVADDPFGIDPQDGLAALAYARSGSVEIPIEPGTYDVLAWHGTRFEAHEERVVVEGGELTEVEATGLVLAWNRPGWFRADTHVHAAPSFDGKISPTDRALVTAAVGVDVWFATEHDVAVDHRPLVRALDLDDVLHVVPAMEVTPFVRGHFNVFPIEVDPDLRAGGAFNWWENIGPTTDQLMADIRAWQPDALIQVNHPFSPGMPSLAGWSEGEVARAGTWTEDFDVLEVIVPGQDPKGLDLYVDLTRRGLLPAATGSTDSHDWLDNANGMLATWIHVPEAATTADLTDEALVEALRARRTVATNGPLLELDPPPGSTVVGSGTLTVTVWSPSWMPVERLLLLRDGEVVDVAALEGGASATFDLDAPADAAYVVVAESDTGPTGPGGNAAWAVASSVLLDVDGDGWEAPFGPLAR